MKRKYPVARPKNLDVFVHYRFPGQLARLVKAAAKAEGMPASVWVRRILSAAALEVLHQAHRSWSQRTHGVITAQKELDRIVTEVVASSASRDR